MGINSKRIKERAIEICESDDYQLAKDEEFHEYFCKEIDESTKEFIWTEEEVQELINNFTFPDEDEWCMEKACGEVDDYYDAKYEEEKDRKMGL